jgi:hypothetical protein
LACHLGETLWWESSYVIEFYLSNFKLLIVGCIIWFWNLQIKLSWKLTFICISFVLYHYPYNLLALTGIFWVHLLSYRIEIFVWHEVSSYEILLPVVNL